MSDLNDVFQKAAAERGFDAEHSAGHVAIVGLSSSRERTAVVHENPLSEEELAVLGKFVPLSEYWKTLNSLNAQNMVQQKDLFLKNVRGLIREYKDKAPVEHVSGNSVSLSEGENPDVQKDSNASLHYEKREQEKVKSGAVSSPAPT
ncbi:MAG: hypothetical protein J6Y93_05145 [Treponema sp.]|nr:hypothetical protein [Treponema sp.]